MKYKKKINVILQLMIFALVGTTYRIYGVKCGGTSGYSVCWQIETNKKPGSVENQTIPVKINGHETFYAGAVDSDGNRCDVDWGKHKSWQVWCYHLVGNSKLPTCYNSAAATHTVFYVTKCKSTLKSSSQK